MGELPCVTTPVADGRAWLLCGLPGGRCGVAWVGHHGAALAVPAGHYRRRRGIGGLGPCGPGRRVQPRATTAEQKRCRSAIGPCACGARSVPSFTPPSLTNGNSSLTLDSRLLSLSLSSSSRQPQGSGGQRGDPPVQEAPDAMAQRRRLARCSGAPAHRRWRHGRTGVGGPERPEASGRAGGSRMATREARSRCCWCWGWVTPCCTCVAGLTSSLASGSRCASSSPASTSRSTSGRSRHQVCGVHEQRCGDCLKKLESSMLVLSQCRPSPYCSLS